MTVKLPIRSLARGRQEAIHREEELATIAEKLVAEEFGVTRAIDEREWYDLVDESTGTKYQVKSTSSTIGEKYPGDGRFRLWRSQHRSMAASQGQGHAWYAFVLINEDTGEIWIQRRKPTTITRWINDRGGWYDSGHLSMGEQYKLPWTVVYD